MRKRLLSEVDELTAAWMFAVQGLPQAEIAGLLGVSAPVISRVLKRLERQQYFAREWRFNEANVDPAVLERVRERVEGRPLAERLARITQRRHGRNGPTLSVLPAAAARDADGGLASFSLRAAPIVARLVARSRVWGVTWGRMLLNVAQALPKVGLPATMAKDIEVVPLAGEPLGQEPNRSSSSTLASEFGRLVRGEKYHAPSLTMVPALIPRDFKAAEQAVVWKLVQRLPDYTRILGSSRSGEIDGTVAGRVDFILTSIGREPLGFLRGSLLEAREQQLFVGDIGGVLLPREDLTDAQSRAAQAIADRWTGLQRAHLERCALRAARTDGPPGVTVISTGADRAPVLATLVREGLVNHLIIDTALERALEQELESEG